MALIPFDQFGTLKSASEVKGVADSAKLDYETLSVAKLINTAANTGEYQVIYNHEMSEDLISLLKGQGYAVTHKPRSAIDGFQYIISWE